MNNSNKKWKCEDIGLESVYVVLKLEKSTKINGIDIGNENSAFVEVSVGRTGWPVDKFKVTISRTYTDTVHISELKEFFSNQTILVTSSFMTIIESRVSECPNRVRCFGKDALMPDVADEKWDLVKVTCTQGFKKHVQFGLSFIKIHTPDAVPASSVSASSISIPNQTVTRSPKEKKSCDEALGLPKTSVFAKFRMRLDSSDSDKESESSTTLFSKWKQNKDSPIKETSNLSGEIISDESSNLVVVTMIFDFSFSSGNEFFVFGIENNNNI